MDISGLLIYNQKEVIGLPWWLSGKQFTCRGRRHGFDSWSGKIPHAAEQLRVCATSPKPAHLSPEPQLLSPRARALQREGSTMGSPRSAIREWPPLATTREKLVQHRRARTVTHTHTHTHTHTEKPCCIKKKVIKEWRNPQHRSLTWRIQRRCWQWLSGRPGLGWCRHSRFYLKGRRQKDRYKYKKLKWHS